MKIIFNYKTNMLIDLLYYDKDNIIKYYWSLYDRDFLLKNANVLYHILIKNDNDDIIGFVEFFKKNNEKIQNKIYMNLWIDDKYISDEIFNHIKSTIKNNINNKNYIYIYEYIKNDEHILNKYLKHFKYLSDNNYKLLLDNEVI